MSDTKVHTFTIYFTNLLYVHNLYKTLSTYVWTSQYLKTGTYIRIKIHNNPDIIWPINPNQKRLVYRSIDTFSIGGDEPFPDNKNCLGIRLPASHFIQYKVREGCIHFFTYYCKISLFVNFVLHQTTSPFLCLMRSKCYRFNFQYLITILLPTSTNPRYSLFPGLLVTCM